MFSSKQRVACRMLAVISANVFCMIHGFGIALPRRRHLVSVSDQVLYEPLLFSGHANQYGLGDGCDWSISRVVC